MTRDEIIQKLKGELDNIYCYNCAYNGIEEPCDWCHRKYMQWKPSDELLNSIADMVERKEE